MGKGSFCTRRKYSHPRDLCCYSKACLPLVDPHILVTFAQLLLFLRPDMRLGLVASLTLRLVYPEPPAIVGCSLSALTGLVPPV